MKGKTGRNTTLQVILILVFITLTTALFFLLDNRKNHNKQHHLQHATERYQLAYNTIYDQYKQLSQNIYSGILTRYKIQDVYQKLLTANEEQKNRLRADLLNKIQPRYEELKKTGSLRQLHFHLKNNESFLRLHQPEKYGDNLTSRRETVNYVNTKYSPIDGFEEGRIYSGYRFVFPITATDQTHLGSMEISFGPDVMTSAMMKQYFVLSNFYIKETITKNKLFPDQLKKNYKKSHHNGYLFDKKVLAALQKVSRKEMKDLKPQKNITNAVYANAHSDRAMSLYDPAIDMVFTTIPVLNPVTHEMIAFLTVRSQPEFFINEMQYFRTIFSLSLLLLVMILSTFYLGYNKKKILESNTKQLEDQVRLRTAKLLTANKSLENEINERTQMEEELRIERDNLINIFEAMADGIYIVNQQYDIQYVNKVLQNDFGNYEGKKCYEYFHNRQEACSWCKNPDVFTGKTVRWEWQSSRNQRVYDLIDTPLRNSDGSISKLEIFRDITEIKHAEIKLKESEEKYKLLAENSADVIYKLNLKSKQYTYVSPSIKRIFGYTVKEGLLLKAQDVLTAESYEKQRNELIEAIANKCIVPKMMELEAVHKDGHTFPVEIHTNFIFDDQGHPVEILGIVRDITERKRAEWALRESEDKFRSLVEVTSDWIWEVNTKGIYTYVSPMVEKILGYKPEELVGKTPFKIMLPDEAERIKVIFRDLVEKGEPINALENVCLHKDGRFIVIETSGVQVLDATGKITGYRGVDRDITKRKQAEEKLQKSEEKFKFLTENMSDIVWTLDMDLNATYMSPSVEKNLGYTIEERMLQKMEDTVTPESFERIMALLVEELEREKIVGVDLDRPVNIEVEYFHKNGSIVWMENNIKAIRDESNAIIGMYGVSHNITERKKTQEALAEKNSLLDNILRNALDIAIATTDLDFRINYFNPTAEKVFGYKMHDVVGKTVYEMHAKQRVPVGRFEKTIEQVRLNGEYLFSVEQETVKGTMYIDCRVSSILDPIGKLVGYALFSRDVTVQKEAEKILLQNSRIESISTLTGGIAHDFNNLLSVILGNIELAGLEIKTDLAVSKFLKNAGKALLQAKTLTQQLVVFSKGGAPLKKAGSIVDVIKQTTSHVLEDTNVKCNFLLPPKLWSVEFDKNQIKQAIKNLVVNAVESMPDGGTIVIKAKNLNATAKQGLPITSGKHIKISIQDQGIGMSKEHLPMIFDPYFSTKDMGTQKGVGLGLATTYSIINRHDGHIIVESEVGVGSIFTLYLPAYEKAAKELDRKKILTPEKPAIKTGRILLMDDEKMIRDVGKLMLNRFGYTAELAKEGAEAIELYKKSLDSGKPFEVVILDLTVKGGMGGQETMRRLLEIDPVAKGIVSTGYSDDPVVSNFRSYGFSGFLNKPVTMADLEKVINEVISNDQ